MSPYAAFIEILTTVILPVFESFTGSSIPAAPLSFAGTASRPTSPVDVGGGSSNNDVVDVGCTATAAGGSIGADVVDGGFLTGGSPGGGSLMGHSLASDSVAEKIGDKLPGTADSITGGEEFAALPELRVIELKTMGDSEVEADVEAARMLLPEPAVPAPDPKMVAIPPEKVRQQVRRPAPRAKRQPLQILEILPVQPQEASPPSSRPGSRNAAVKAKVEAQAKVEQKAAAPAQHKHQGGGGDAARAVSGALEGNPYRWVVSSIVPCSLRVRTGMVAKILGGARLCAWLVLSVLCRSLFCHRQHVSKAGRGTYAAQTQAPLSAVTTAFVPTPLSGITPTYICTSHPPCSRRLVHQPKRSAPEIPSNLWSSFRAPARASLISP